MNKKYSIVLIQLLCWVGFLYLPVLLYPNLPTNLSTEEKYIHTALLLGTNVLIIGIFYLNLKWLIPHFFFTKQYWQYIFLGLICLSIVLAFHHLLMSPEAMHARFPPPGEGMQPFPPSPNRTEPGFRPGQNRVPTSITYSIFMFLLAWFVSLLLAIYQRWKNAEEQNLSTELSYLKAQINPHFLFNTLNGIYSLAVKKSDDTATAIVKLSGMMRYAITEAHNEKVSLSKEIDYISSYVTLQKLRVGNTVQLSFTISGAITNQQIVPMLLITFVENAFKYGVNAEEDAAIKIELTAEGDKLNLLVYNKKVNKTFQEEEQNGIGLENTKRRLQLLYPGAHHLLIRETEKDFEISLQLTLS